MVTEVIDEENFEADAMAQVKELSDLPIRSMAVSKALVQVRDPPTGPRTNRSTTGLNRGPD